jgi:hypothetical protein
LHITDPSGCHIYTQNNNILTHNELGILWVVLQMLLSVPFCLLRPVFQYAAVTIESDGIDTATDACATITIVTAGPAVVAAVRGEEIMDQKRNASLSLEHIKLLRLTVSTHNDDLPVYLIGKVGEPHQT